MARRSNKGEEGDGGRTMALAVPQPETRHAGDPYEPAIGAVPHDLKTSTRPLKRKLTPAEEANRTQLENDHKARIELYHAYLDELPACGGDKIKAIARAFRITDTQAMERLDELMAIVAMGRGASPVTKLLERADLDISARIAMLRKHVYSDVPAASLKALDMVEQITGAKANRGSFEDYLLLVKDQG